MVTSTEFSALITISNGRLRFLDGATMAALVACFAEGEELEMHVEPSEAQGTGKQRRYFHGPVLDPFVRNGWTRAAAKAHLCITYIPVEFLLPDGTTIIAPGHTSTLSRKRYNELIEASIEEVATRFGEVVKSSEEWLESQRPKRKRS